MPASEPHLARQRRRFRAKLLNRVIPLWESHGINHDHGGFYHGLAYDGTLLGPEKISWFQGRGLWTWSFLYKHFGHEARHLEVARPTKEILLGHAPQPDEWWA